MKKKIALIAVLIIAITAFMFYEAIEKNKKNVQELKEAGYIINSQKLTGNTEGNGQVYYFNAATKYTKTYDNRISFTDTEGKTAKVPENSFVHYENNAIGVLKKSVIVNVEDILNQNLQYYNFFPNNLLIKNGDTYEFENLGNTIKFKSLIVKTDDNKYLILSDGMKVSLDDSRQVDITDNYIEISIVDEEVVRLDNRNVNYQTIGKKSSIILGEDIVLNLDNHYIFKEKEPIFTLDQMIINSQDNINITELEPEPEPEDDVEYDENGNIINNGGSSEENNGGGGGGGTTGESFFEDEKEVDDTSAKLPTAVIDDIEITSNKIKSSIKITDDDSLMSSPTKVTVTENSTGRHIYEEKFESGNYNLAIEADNLEPNTTYNLSVRITYTKDDIEYVTDAISQLFTTESLGINLEKEFATNSEVSYRVKFDNYSKVKSCDISIRNTNGETIGKLTVTAEDAKSAEGFNAVFTDLDKNTKYSIIVNNILYDNYIISDEYNIEESVKTLKERPTFGNLSFTIDKKNSSFVLSLNNIKDQDNGIESYKYEIYDARSYSEGVDPIKTVEKPTRGSVEVEIDEKTLSRGVPYIYRVVTEFYDNEKYIEYITPLSQIMRMDGVEGAHLTWSPQEITFERIQGVITITDPANTIDLNKDMKIVYTNSVGTTKQFTTAGNLVIPIDIKNLRQNESYNIALYATVDFQDGNEEISEYYVGSVTVTTNPTKPIETTYVPVEASGSEAFSIRAQLKQGQGYDNTLEALTLSGITFSLYEGKNENGKFIKSIKYVDKDLREYYSELKEEFYDTQFILNPRFFSLSNSDINSEYVTIVISEAYDYTDFKNSIEILNNKVTVKANNLAPDNPVDTENALEYEYIRNRNANAEHQDTDLDGNTIVGIKVKALYDNTRRYAKYIDYSVYDADTGNKMNADVRYEVANDGQIDYIEYYFENGTTFETVDSTVLTRGHTYYVTYTAGLKLGDNDNITIYPADGTLLRSKDIEVPKQAAIITTYPSISENGAVTLKYTLKDVDNALYRNIFIAKMGANKETLAEVSRGTVEQTNTYKTVKLNGLYDGFLGVYVSQALLKKDSEVKETELLYRYYRNPIEVTGLTYSMQQEVNRLLITIDGYDENNPRYQKITGLKITFSQNGNEVVKDYQVIGDSNISVMDLFEIANFKGNPVNVKVEAYYDNEKVGYDLPGPVYAIQKIQNEYGGGNYYTIVANQSLYDNGSVAMGNLHNKVATPSEIIMTSAINNLRINIPFEPDSSGLQFNYDYLLLKGIDKSTVNPSGASSFTFSQIIPGIKMTDSYDKSTIVPEIRTVNIKGILYGFDVAGIENGEITAELYETDANGTRLDPLSQTTVDLSTFTSGFEIGGLVPNQNYAIKFSANVSDGNGGYERKYLYDVDANTDNRTYYFKTLSSVPISQITHVFKFTRYDNKKLEFTYTLGKLVGYDKIRYKLYKLTSYNSATHSYDREVVNINIADETRFTSNMTLQIPCNPGSVFEFGQRYVLVIQPIVLVEVDGETHEVELSSPGEYTFNLRKLRRPTFNVRSSVYGDDGYLEFTVSIYDTDRVITDNMYSITMKDSSGNDLTPTEYVNQKYSIFSYNRKFTLTGLSLAETYTLSIFYKVDMNNDTTEEQTVSTFTTRTLNSIGIDVGDVSSSTNAISPQKIDLKFLNSSKLLNIDTIVYAVYNSADGTTISGEASFTPTQVSIGNGNSAYIFTLPNVNLPSQGVYLIQLQFLSDGTMVSDLTIEHTYIVIGG